MIRAVGLTGGIGSGKSAVADGLAARGAAVVDTDAIARELTAPGGAALSALAREFGAGVIGADGALDRAAMRGRVFADPAERRNLAAERPQLVKELQAELAAWLATETRRPAPAAAKPAARR